MSADDLGQTTADLRRRLAAVRRRCVLTIHEMEQTADGGFLTIQGTSSSGGPVVREWHATLKLLRGRLWECVHGQGSKLADALADAVDKAEQQGWHEPTTNEKGR